MLSQIAAIGARHRLGVIPSHSLNTGLRIHLDKDAVDLTGLNDNFIVGGGTPGTRTGKVFAECIDLPGAPAHYELPLADAADVELDADRSIAFWMICDTVFSTYPLIFGKTAGTNWRGYLNPNGSLTVNFGGTAVVSAISAVTQSNWHHIVFRYNDATGLGTLTVDNTHVTKTSGGDNANAYNFHLGDTTGGGVYNLNGGFDQFAVWDRLITDSEITELYNSGAGFDFLP